MMDVVNATHYFWLILIWGRSSDGAAGADWTDVDGATMSSEAAGVVSLVRSKAK